MGTGISMSSVNKIKELAESRDYSLALDILEHQDLTKSLSPQFIKICGEVYYENGRYQEARAALVKAHSMAPVGNKIIYSLIRVYLSMGFYSLANTYYEIYKFNQNEKDAGTYRIEYMLAKAERKPYKELYGILISANEKETSDIWDFEMLLLYKAMGNEEKFQSEAEMFCATYKGSSYIDKVNQLREKLYDVDKAIYCYPETEAMDDDIAQQDVRLMEEKVLEADDLRIHPKDPKITLMVEDREPVTNSMKFKQMLLKSKEKKESKKLQKQGKKAEQQKEQTDQEENTGKKKWFLKNRMSKKEEEAIEEAFAEQENSEVDRDQLLGEIVNPESDETVAENGMEAEAEPVADPTGDEKKPRSLDELSEDSFEDGVDDFDFDNEEYDSVLMVDVDDAIMPEPSNEHTEEILEEAPEEIISEDITDASDVEKPENVESEEPEKSETDEQQIEKKSEYTESVEDHEIAEAETKDAKEPETSESNEEDADSAGMPGSAGEDDDSVVIEEVEEAEESELEETAETAEPAEDAEKAEMLEENQELELESTDTMEKTTSDDPFDIDIAIQSLDEYTFDADTWEDDSFEQAYEDDDIVEIEAATGSDTKVEVETENEAEAEVEIEPEVEVRADSEPGSELEVEAEADSEKESESETEAEMDVEIDSEAVVEMNLEAEVNPESETEQEPEYGIESEKTAHRRDFPIFRSSLFPDYNSDKPPVVELMKETVDMKAEYDRKMSDNLEKEEQLINQADELLARLGIELGTKYASNTDYFNMHSDSFVNLIEDETDVENADLSSDEKVISEQEDNRKEQLEHLDKKQEKKYKLKRNDK